MVGLVFNGLRVFDLTANKDPRTTSKGDVQQLSSVLDRLNEHSLLDTMQQVNFRFDQSENDKIQLLRKSLLSLRPITPDSRCTDADVVRRENDYDHVRYFLHLLSFFFLRTKKPLYITRVYCFFKRSF